LKKGYVFNHHPPTPPLWGGAVGEGIFCILLKIYPFFKILDKKRS
jgi:hypothetical protein